MGLSQLNLFLFFVDLLQHQRFLSLSLSLSHLDLNLLPFLFCLFVFYCSNCRGFLGNPKKVEAEAAGEDSSASDNRKQRVLPSGREKVQTLFSILFFFKKFPFG
jgi:hypothetical protein